MRRSAGFSLIELLVSAALLAIVMVGITQAFTTQHQTYTVVDQVTEAQQNLRAVADLMERDVRRAGYMVPPHAALCAFDNTTSPDVLFVSRADAIRSIYDLEDDNEDLTPNKGAPVTGTGATFVASGASQDLVLERDWVDVAADGADFVAGEGVIVVNRNRQDASVACGTITEVAGLTVTANLGATSTGAVGLNADVIAIPAHKYEVVEAAGVPSRLERNGQLLASDVEDFQITYFFDTNDDLVADANELFAAAGETAQPWELTPIGNRPDFSMLREVGINLVTVTRTDDPNVDYQIGAGQVTGNRTAGSLPSGDGKRRRVHQARVRMRNTR